MTRMFQIAVAVAMLAAGPDSEAAFANLRTLPAERQVYQAYLTTGVVAAEHRETLANVLRFVVPSMSSRPYLGDQIPQVVHGTNLLRIDLEGLGWEKTWPQVISQHYAPQYRPDLPHGQVPLVVSGLWVAAALTDSNVTGDGQYQLLYSGKPPATLSAFEAFWKVNGDPFLAYARMEGKSGVSVVGERVLQNLPTSNRGYYWRTLDSRVIAGETDQLENIAKKDIKHDASEAIAAIPKHIGGEGGMLQAYFLADGGGKRQEKAPADIVRDDTGTRGIEIRNTLSCIACHTEGIRHPTLDKFASYIQSGARIYVKEKANQQEIDRYFQSPIAKEIERNNADYAAGVKLCNGLTPLANAQAFQTVVRLYDAPVTPEQAARERYTTPDELRLALADYSRTYQLTGRLALLAEGETITRDQFLANIKTIDKAIYAWHVSH